MAERPTEPLDQCSGGITEVYRTGLNQQQGFNDKEGCVYAKGNLTDWRVTNNFNMNSAAGVRQYDNMEANAERLQTRVPEQGVNKANQCINSLERAASSPTLGGLLGAVTGAIRNCKL